MNKAAMRSGGLAAALVLAWCTVLEGGCYESDGALGGEGGGTSSTSSASASGTTSSTDSTTSSTQGTATSTDTATTSATTSTDTATTSATTSTDTATTSATTSTDTATTSVTTSTSSSTTSTSSSTTSSTTVSTSTTSTSSSTDTPSGTGGAGGGGPTADPSLLVHYTFDEGSGTTAGDASGHAHDGALMGSASWAAQGHIGGAVLLSGADPYVQLPADILDPYDTVTIAVWVNLQSLDPWSRIFDFGGSVDANNFNANFMFLTPFDGGTSMRLDANNTSAGKDVVVSTSQLPKVGAWHHVVFKAAPFAAPTAGYELWLDGNLVGFSPFAGKGQVLISHLAPTPTNYLGKSHFPDAYLKGMLDDFRIYTRALTAAEIVALASQ